VPRREAVISDPPGLIGASVKNTGGILILVALSTPHPK